MTKGADADMEKAVLTALTALMEQNKQLMELLVSKSAQTPVQIQAAPARQPAPPEIIVPAGAQPAQASPLEKALLSGNVREAVKLVDGDESRLYDEAEKLAANYSLPFSKMYAPWLNMAGMQQ